MATHGRSPGPGLRRPENRNAGLTRGAQNWVRIPTLVLDLRSSFLRDSRQFSQKSLRLDAILPNITQSPTGAPAAWKVATAASVATP